MNDDIEKTQRRQVTKLKKTPQKVIAMELAIAVATELAMILIVKSRKLRNVEEMLDILNLVQNCAQDTNKNAREL